MSTDLGGATTTMHGGRLIARRLKANGVRKLFTLSGGMVEGISGVQIGPGATAFTRIPFSPSICARPAVKLETAPLVEA